VSYDPTNFNHLLDWTFLPSWRFWRSGCYDETWPVERHGGYSVKDLWVPVSGAIAQQRYVDTIANNVANANTPGFKKDSLTFREHLTALEKGADINLPNKEWSPGDFYKSYGAEKAFVKTDGTYTDHTQGQLSPSGSPMDAALNGPGLYEFLTPNGVRYGRKGSFSLSNDGVLVNDQGHPVLSRIDLPDAEGEDLGRVIAQIPSPAERVIRPGEGRISFGQQGEVFVGDNKIADISVVEFNDMHALRKDEGSYFLNADAGNVKKGELKTTVNQGFVEQSNVNVIHEMAELIKAHRNFESIQRVIKTYDNISGKAANEINRF
jgi:flagellar basal-body rod protein FlgG